MNKPIFLLKDIVLTVSTSGVEKLLLDSVNLSLFPMARLGLLGSSGSGKTTLARIITGFIQPSSGQVFFENKPLLKPQKDVQLVFQNPFESLTPHLTVFDLLSDSLRKTPSKIRARVIFQAASSLNLSNRHLNAYPHQLSGGEAQRVALVRALLQQPKILICDEILACMDAPLQKEVLQLLLKLQQKYQFSIIWITHDLVTSISFCTDQYLLKDQQLFKVDPQNLGSCHPYMKKLVEAKEWIVDES